MTRIYRLGLGVLGLTFMALSLSIFLVDPVVTSQAVTAKIFSAAIWGGVFALGGAVLLAAAVLDADRLVIFTMGYLAGCTAAYAFAAWLVVVQEHTGWQVASRVTALGICHALLLLRGPDYPDPVR